MGCKTCESMKVKGKEKIFSDERVAVILSKTPASIGHTIVYPREHYTIMEQVPDDILGEMFTIANKLSVLLFETMNAQGTNIIIQNGVNGGQVENHFCMHVIPRRQNDGLNFEWQGRKASEDELSTAKMKYDEFCKNLLVQTPKNNGGAAAAAADKKDDEEHAVEEIKQKDGEENYLIKSLDRIP